MQSAGFSFHGLYITLKAYCWRGRHHLSILADGFAVTFENILTNDLWSVISVNSFPNTYMWKCLIAYLTARASLSDWKYQLFTSSSLLEAYAIMHADFDPSLLVCIFVKIAPRLAGDQSTINSVPSLG